MTDIKEIKRQKQATLLLIRVNRMIARRFKLCPACLLFNTADAMMDAIEAGRIEHGELGDDDSDHPVISRVTH